MGLRENQKLAQDYPILQFFKFNHLPANLQKISRPFQTVAWAMARELPRNAETTTCLRKLLEGKDAAIRGFLYEPRN